MPQYTATAFCFDNKYAPYATVATYSLIKNSKIPLKIYWVTFSEDIECANAHLKYLKKFSHEIVILDAGNHFQGWKESGHITKATYLRLLLPTLINESKLIYLDCDTLILSDLNNLFKIEMKEFPIGGVLDPGGSRTSKLPRNSTDVYINSGVLLMNLDVLRNDHFLKKCETIHSTHHDTLSYGDQCVINKYAEERKLILESKWNSLIWAGTTEVSWDEAVGSANILHFISGHKPWKKSYNTKIADFWWGYANHLEIPNL